MATTAMGKLVLEYLSTKLAVLEARHAAGLIPLDRHELSDLEALRDLAKRLQFGPPKHSKKAYLALEDLNVTPEKWGNA
jgi:hypothetical protein